MGDSDTGRRDDTLSAEDLQDFGQIEGNILLLEPGESPEVLEEVNRLGMLGWLLSLEQYADDDDLITELERTVDAEELDQLFLRIIGLERDGGKFDARIKRLARLAGKTHERAGKLEAASAEQAELIVSDQKQLRELRELIRQQTAKLAAANRDRFIEMIRVSEEYDSVFERLELAESQNEATDKCVDELVLNHGQSVQRTDRIVNLISLLVARNAKSRTERAELADGIRRGEVEREGLRADVNADHADYQELLRRVNNLEDGQVELTEDVWGATLARDRMDEQTNRISGRIDEVMTVVSKERHKRRGNTVIIDDTLRRIGHLEDASRGVESVASLDRDYERADGVDVAAPLSFDPDDDEESVSLDSFDGVHNLPLPASARSRPGRTAIAAGMLMGLAIVISLLFSVQITHPFANANEGDDDYVELDEDLPEETFEVAIEEPAENEPGPDITSFIPPQEPQPEPAQIICQSFGNWELRQGAYWLPMLNCSDGFDRLCPKAEVDARTFNCDFYQPSE